LRNDPARTGKVADERLTGLIKGLRAASLTKKTERACKEGTVGFFLARFVNASGAEYPVTQGWTRRMPVLCTSTTILIGSAKCASYMIGVMNSQAGQ
jgi:hypothetical protein